MVYLEGTYLVNFSISHQFLYWVVSVKAITSKYLKINKLYTYTGLTSLAVYYNFLLFFFFYRSTFVGSAWSFIFFIPATTANDPPPTSKDFYTRSYPLHYFLILILEKEPVFPFLMFSAKQGNYWYHFYNVRYQCMSYLWMWMFHLMIVLGKTSKITNIRTLYIATITIWRYNHTSYI